ncbi:hypothetical protein VNO78_18391 [Psophocarpus tetragonolobus]|uniref:SBg7S n=1 Tax=Psophocarpus tetragonolobus TaxID=3891 RepID=A0AAN9SIC3_PSOTE
MAYILDFLALSLLFFLSESVSPTTPSKLLVLPVQQDAATGLYLANLHKRTPLTNVPVVVDLNGKHLWVNCEQKYSSKTYQAPFCHSTQCSRANTQQCLSCPGEPRPGCHKNSCALMSTNPITQQTGLGELGLDVLAINSLQAGSSQLGPLVTVPRFLFSCAPSFLVQKGLPQNIQGVLGLGYSPISLPNQLASHFGLQRQFTTCLSRYYNPKGAIIFGDAPTNLPHFHDQDIFRDLAYIPLTITPQGEYNVRVNAIRINQHSVFPSNEISSTVPGHSGGTMISTSTSYLTLQQSLYQSFIQLFSQQLPKQAQVKPVGSFGLCFNSKYKITAYPSVELVMDRPNGPVWRISGEDLMVQAQAGVTCLGVMNGGVQPRAEITLGARQLEENLVVFDLARSRLGFTTSPLRSHGIKCSDLFNLVNA